MAYQKFSATQLFDGYRILGNDQVLIAHADGTIEGIVHRKDAGDDIQELTGILSPGFVNCHCHLELSHMKGAIPEKTGLIEFVYHVIRNRHFSETEILNAINTGEEEMLGNGIVAVGDICNNSLTAQQKSKGRLLYYNFIEAAGFNDQVAEQRFQHAVTTFQRFASPNSSIVPHAPYSVANALWERILAFPGSNLFTIHNQETPPENELFRSKKGEFLSFFEKMGIDISWFTASGKTSLQTYLPKFVENQQLILVHNVVTSKEDVQFSKSHPHIFWCLCPNANLYISGALPDIPMLIEEGCQMVLGTDSLAANHRLSILDEMKTIRKHFGQIKLEELFKWATINGAKALQMDDTLGSFEKAKKPGIIISAEDLSSVRRLV